MKSKPPTRPKKTGLCATRGVSFPDDLYASALNRIADLNPAVRTFSEYLQKLVALDLANDILGKIPAISMVAGTKIKFQAIKAKKP